MTSSLTSELVTLSEDIDALKERKKLVAEQVAVLLFSAYNVEGMEGTTVVNIIRGWLYLSPP